MADSSLAEGRLQFFLGATEWEPGQPKPLWTELVKALGDDFKPIIQLVYADE